MVEATVREQITLARETIHNPKEPRHFMRIKPAKGRVRILREGRAAGRVGKSAAAAGSGPRSLRTRCCICRAKTLLRKLAGADKLTHCPLKGDARYFDLCGDNDNVEAAEIAWEL